MKHEGWINITKLYGIDIDNNPVEFYRSNIVYKNKKTALKFAKAGDVATIKIRWED